MNKYRFFLFVLILLLFQLLNGCLSNERYFQINIKSAHTWTLDVKVDVKVWENYSMIDLDPNYSYSKVKELYINEIDVFDIRFNFDEIGYIEILINASTIDGFYDEYKISSFELEEDYYFEVIGSGNEVKIIQLNKK
jgi:hypothetical protein